MRGDQIMQRATALTVPCTYCRSRIGERCVDPRTGWELENQPAHSVRLREAQVL